jgi:putative N6-adenine-specific DNA methylase
LNNYFAVSAPGLEPFTRQELIGLDLLPETDNQSAAAGGIEFKGELSDLYRANLQLRTASRILARLGNFFYATTFAELQKRASRLPWERFLTAGQPVALRVSSHASRLYHTDAVARSISSALEERLGQPSPLTRLEDEAEGHSAQLIIVRLVDDKCTLSVDSSGELLHKRGYRQAVAKAPLRETLAAALLMASGWDSEAPLLDPFCGSGTIPIEAALMALKLPPGLNRRFACMDWPGFDQAAFNTLRSATSQEASMLYDPGSGPSILASDRDAGAIKMAHDNAARAGVEHLIDFKCQAVSSIQPPVGLGWVVTNPPYGLRISAGKDLRNLYAQFGNVLRQHCPGWQVAVLCNDPILLGQMRLDLDTSLGFINGGIGLRVAKGKV